MDNVAYLMNRKFILIAVDTNYQVNFNDDKIHLIRARKVHKLNNTNAISLIGNPYKITNIMKYVLKLNELGYNDTFDRIIEDLKDAFDTSKVDILHGLVELSHILPNYIMSDGNVDVSGLFNSVKDKPEYISILRDALDAVDYSNKGLAQIFVFGWDSENYETRIAQFISVGQNLTEGINLDLSPDIVYMRLASSSVDNTKTSQLEKELINDISPLLTVGWDSDTRAIDAVLEKGKEILSDGLRKISPYLLESNIVYYELSPRTNFEFVEPDLKLMNIVFNKRNNIS